MKKKIISLLLVLALCLGMTFSVSAEDAEGFANDYCRVQDMAGLMTDSEEAKLNDILDELSIRQKMDAGIKYSSKETTSDLKDGNYFSAFQTFSELCDKFITQARNGKPYDRKSLPKEPLSPIWILISLGVGVVLSLIIVGRMKAQLKTVRFQSAAGSYVKDDSLDITESRDMFLYETTSKTAKEKKSSSGGSSTHTSSSGRTHGGGGSKF